MECIDTFVGSGKSFYVLFYEEIDTGDHLSRVYWFSGSTAPEIRLIAEVQEWLVSLWANAEGALWAACWDGRIFRLGLGVDLYATVDLFGTIKLSGFGAEPQFIMGEDGLIFENRGQVWTQVRFRGAYDIYSVAERRSGAYWFVASGGRLICYEDGVASVERLPTNLDLHGIAFLDPDKCLVAGDEGVAFLYESGPWRDITEDNPSLPDVHAFKDRFILSIEGERIDSVDEIGQYSPSSAKPGYYFSSNGTICVTFYEEAALVFDGANWSEVPFGRLLSLEHGQL